MGCFRDAHRGKNNVPVISEEIDAFLKEYDYELDTPVGSSHDRIGLLNSYEVEAGRSFVHFTHDCAVIYLEGPAEGSICTYTIPIASEHIESVENFEKFVDDIFESYL